MDWPLFLLFPGAVLSHPMRLCTSCDEFVGKNCRRNLGSCRPRYPDFACQTKEVYTQHFTGGYSYQYSILGCPKKCVEYVRISRGEKIVFFCCNGSYCNSLNVKEQKAKERRYSKRVRL
uniref:UPAR/Ly6 domain-containing protein n=1 Tax=Canis lupus dingo TaxID=286419 RepID=A0A8C0QYP3_CANLU